MSALILERCKLLTRWAFEYFDQTTSPFVKGTGLGCLVFVIGASLMATSFVSAAVTTLLFAAATLCAGYLTFNGKISKGYGIVVAVVCILLTLTSMGKIIEKQDERQAEQARIEQQQQQKEAEERSRRKASCRAALVARPGANR